MTIPWRKTYSIASLRPISLVKIGAPKRWVPDVTYIATLEGWLYLTVILDLADRQAIGWALSDSLKAVDVDTSVAAWRMALINRPVTTQLIFHSDRAIQ